MPPPPTPPPVAAPVDLNAQHPSIGFVSTVSVIMEADQDRGNVMRFIVFAMTVLESFTPDILLSLFVVNTIAIIIGDVAQRQVLKTGTTAAMMKNIPTSLATKLLEVMNDTPMSQFFVMYSREGDFLCVYELEGFRGLTTITSQICERNKFINGLICFELLTMTDQQLQDRLRAMKLREVNCIYCMLEKMEPNPNVHQLMGAVKASMEQREPKPCVNCGMSDAKKACGACFRMYYCGKECQKAHWTSAHKQDCVAFR